jgi:hypothetical protein
MEAKKFRHITVATKAGRPALLGLKTRRIIAP